ncbi:MAG: V-type ATP synthase subunit K [Dethiobacteria bacterium]|jgi:V/A-type H+-transporting ATPase subunit K|nr:V-type ATP synthase subunit K [Bacillota bacterium]
MTFNFGLIGIGAAFAISAFGSALGTGVAAQAAVGAWKRAYLQNRQASFLLVAFTGFPLSQTFYGLILMNSLVGALNMLDGGALLGIGLFGGMAIGASAYLQGKAAAGACDAFGETGKGFANYVLVLGIIESVALLAMVFLMNVIGAITA